jgi:hypothetical protein
MARHVESGGSSPTIEHLPGDIVRMHTVADRQLVHRMAFAAFASTRWLWWSLGIVLIAGPAVIAWIGGADAEQLSVGDLLFYLIFGVVFFIVFAAGVLYRSGPDYWRLYKLPIGNTIYVDVAPEWIGVGWSDRYTALARRHIERVSVHKSVLVIVGCGYKILAPCELIPIDTANLLQSESKRRDSTDSTAPPRTAPPQRPPFSTDPPEATENQAIRTHATADHTLANRLAVSVRQSSAIRKVTLLLLILGVVGGIGLFLDDERPLDSMFLALLATCAAGYGIIGYHMFLGAAAHLRRVVPEGTALTAEFGPDWIGIRLGGYYEAFGAARIIKMERVDSALIATIQGPADGVAPRRSAEGLVIPTELTPTDVVEGLLQRYG